MLKSCKNSHQWACHWVRFCYSIGRPLSFFLPHETLKLALEETVKDASLSLTYSFLPASWVGDTHEETDFLPIGDQEERGNDF